MTRDFYLIPREESTRSQYLDRSQTRASLVGEGPQLEDFLDTFVDEFDPSISSQGVRVREFESDLALFRISLSKYPASMTGESSASDYIDFYNDGRTDRLTGLDAPEIFYRMLQREMAALARRVDRRLFLVVLTLKSSHSVPIVSAQLVELANLLHRCTRSDEFLSRLGERSFAMVATYQSERSRGVEGSIAESKEVLAAIVARLRTLVDDSLLQEKQLWRASRLNETSGKESSSVDISGFECKENEELLDLLERAGV